MGRGLGKTQQAILEYLQQHGKPSYVNEIAYDLFHNRQGVRERDSVSRSFDVSVRRAVHALAQRGLVLVGHAPDSRTFIGDPINRLLCWLPDQQAPRLKPNTSGAEVERLVLAILADPDVTTSSPPGHPLNDKWVEYSWLTNRIANLMRGAAANGKVFVYGAPSVATHRAVKRLADKGSIQARWKSYHRYGWVKLNNLNVAQ